MSENVNDSGDSLSIEKRKNLFLEKYKEDPSVSVEEAAKTVGKSPNTIYRWKSADPSFRSKFKEFKLLKWMARTEQIEQRLYSRAMEEDAKMNHILDFMKYLDRKREKHSLDQETNAFSEEELDKIRRNFALEFLEEFGVDFDVISDGKKVRGIKIHHQSEGQHSTYIKNPADDD